ncbi:MAG: GAF domain-containing protein [Chloroflexi bacterium]|nr:GAF domain-containing protein [Chloroflexota bacterium]
MLPTDYFPAELTAEAYKGAFALSLFLGSINDFDALLPMIPPSVRDVLGCEQVMLLTPGRRPNTLAIASVADGINVRSFDTQDITIDVIPDADPFRFWERQQPATLDPAILAGDAGPAAASLMRSIFTILPPREAYSAPAGANGKLYGVLVAQDGTGRIDPQRGDVLTLLARTVGVALANADRYQRSEQERRHRAEEMEIMAQIDRELSDSIQLDDVFAITLDWAIRYSRAHGAYLSLFDETSRSLRPVASLGYKHPPESLLAASEEDNIPLRAALNNRAENVASLHGSPDGSSNGSIMCSHMSVPVTREERVIAVISVESRRADAFSDAHLQFITNLSARAGTAIDNARLYANEVREREKTTSILREIADVVIVVGLDERILLINDSAVNVLCLPADQSCIGRRFAEAFADTPLLGLYQRAVTGGSKSYETISLSEDRTFAASVAHQPDIGWIVTMRDLTELRRADQIKNDFMSVLSHDLKQPVSVVRGYVELLEMRNPVLDERSRYYIAMIFQSLDNMSKLIEDLLDLARLDTGAELMRTQVNLAQLMTNVRDWIRPAAEAKSMRLVIPSGENLPALIGDPNRLTQIFVNLVHNAVKYTPAGGQVEMAIASEGEDMVRFAIRDSGIGIGPEDLKAVFERFYRVRRPETQNVEGSGLGLALVKRLVELHRGRIDVESLLGEGTTFFVTLPAWSD